MCSLSSCIGEFNISLKCKVNMEKCSELKSLLHLEHFTKKYQPWGGKMAKVYKQQTIIIYYNTTIKRKKTQIHQKKSTIQK